MKLRHWEIFFPTFRGNVVAPFSRVEISKKLLVISTLEDETITLPRASRTDYSMTRRQKPTEGHTQLHRYENLRTHRYVQFIVSRLT